MYDSSLPMLTFNPVPADACHHHGWQPFIPPEHAHSSCKRFLKSRGKCESYLHE